MANARNEAEMVLFESVGQVLRATNVSPKKVRELPTLLYIFGLKPPGDMHREYMIRQALQLDVHP